MEENIKTTEKADEKPFFVSALIAETVALLIAAAILLGIKFAMPDTFKKVRQFYGDKIVWSVRLKDKNTDRANVDEI